jgi:hypothetical protein
MDELRVPKRSVPAELQLEGKPTRTLAVFLSDIAPSHAGSERLSDLLETGPAFLPAQDPLTGAPVFVHRERLAWARVPALLEYDELHTSAAASVHAVQLTLSDGTRFSGHVRYLLPPGAARLTDYLNAPQRFVHLHTADEQLLLVHKRYLIEVNVLP